MLLSSKLAARLAPLLLAPLLLAAAGSPPPGRRHRTRPPAPAATPTRAPRVLPGLVKLEFPAMGVRFAVLDSIPIPLGLSAGYGEVGVSIDLNMKSMADCIKRYKDWGSSRGMKALLDKNISANEWVVEFAGGSLGGEKMHVYVRVLFRSGRAYFVKATATEKEWAQGGAKLKACVDSFELMPAPAPAPTAEKTTAATGAKLEFPLGGFRIAPLDGMADASDFQGTFATSFETGPTRVADGIGVRFRVETWTKSLDEYVAKVKKDSSARVVSEKSPAPNTWVMETESREYFRFILANGRLFSAAMSTLPQYGVSPWPELVARGKECVDSLEVMEAPKPAPAQ